MICVAMHLSNIISIFLWLLCKGASGQEGNCSYGDIRLYNGTVPYEGSVQLCTSNNQWSAMCDVSWNCNDATVACNQLGYTDSDPLALDNSYFGKWNIIQFGYFSCSSSETKLISCSKYSHYCNSNDLAGLRCMPRSTECTHGVARLTGGNTADEGRLEMCYNGIWTPVCSRTTYYTNSITGDEEASVVCKELGHIEYPWASIFTEGYGDTPLLKQYLEISCSSSFTENKISDCSSIYLRMGCRKLCEAARIKCFNPGECEEGSIRLVNGQIEQEGRVELCMNGVWGTVCGSSFSQTDAYIACKQFGKGNAYKAPRVYYYSEYGAGIYPIVMSYVSCGGWEKVLTDCNYNSYGSFYCSRSNIVGILCYDECEEGDVRLMGSDAPNAGTVEVCLDGLWGMVAESGWSVVDGQVVCKQMGYTTEGVRVFNNSHYGKAKRPININNVACTGTEDRLLNCKHFEFSFAKRKSLQEVAGVVGVQCGKTTNITVSRSETGLSFSSPSLSPSSSPSCKCPRIYESIIGGIYFTLLLLIIVSVIIIAILMFIWMKIKNSRMEDSIELKRLKDDLIMTKNRVYEGTAGTRTNPTYKGGNTLQAETHAYKGSNTVPVRTPKIKSANFEINMSDTAAYYEEMKQL